MVFITWSLGQMELIIPFFQVYQVRISTYRAVYRHTGQYDIQASIQIYRPVYRYIDQYTDMPVYIDIQASIQTCQYI